MTRFGELLRRLISAKVDFILVGGVAAAAHGSGRGTQDLDIVYRRSPANIARLVDAVEGMQPYLRGAPPGLPFRFDAETVQAGLNFTLTTALGWLDLLGEITGGGKYEDLERSAVTIVVFGLPCRVLDLETLHSNEEGNRPAKRFRRCRRVGVDARSKEEITAR